MTEEELSAAVPAEAKFTLEKSYKRAQVGSKLFIIPVVLAVLTVVLFITDLANTTILGICAGAFLIAIIVACVWYFPASSTLNKTYRKYILQNSMSMTFDNYYFDPNAHISLNSVVATRLFRSNEIDKIKGCDFVSGEYKGVKFSQSFLELIKIVETTDEKGNVQRSDVPIFTGRWMVFDFNKQFLTDITVVEGFDAGNTHGMKRVKLESVVFNKKFKTFAENEHDCFYILTPQLMERLLEIEKNNQGKFLMSFQDGKLSIALNNNKRSFAIRLKGKYDIKVLCGYAIKDIKLITDAVDVLKLNEKIFKQ